MEMFYSSIVLVIIYLSHPSTNTFKNGYIFLYINYNFKKLIFKKSSMSKASHQSDK